MKVWDDMGDDEDDNDSVNTQNLNDILQNPSQNQSSTSRTYIAPTKDEFEECLETTELSWTIVDASDDIFEYVYESADIIPQEDDVVLRCFSTISKNTDVAREKGSDAIRLVIYDKRTRTNMGGRKKTLRIKTYCKNLTEKIESISNETMDYVVTCDECGDFMVIRDGKYGEFMGCRSYPDCQNSQELPDDI